MYAIRIDETGRVICSTFAEFAVKERNKQQEFTQSDMMDGYVLVEKIPDGDLSDYRYESGEFIHDPKKTDAEQPSQLDKIEAQIFYTAMMTDTILEG